MIFNSSLCLFKGLVKGVVMINVTQPWNYHYKVRNTQRISHSKFSRLKEKSDLSSISSRFSPLFFPPSLLPVTPPYRKLLNWLLPLSLPLCTLTVSCMAPYELSAVRNTPNSHCSPEKSFSPSGDILAFHIMFISSLNFFISVGLCLSKQLGRQRDHFI